MNRRWCEGLDWVRVEHLLEIAPEAYTELLTRQFGWMADVYGEDEDRRLHDEIVRRIETWKETRQLLEAGKSLAQFKGRVPDDIQIECFVEATRRAAKNAKHYCELLTKLLRRQGLRVVQGGKGAA